ncbi:hypothetical protein CCR75_007479 [Bremia lactucae]|uniref:Uncharacterized protein n=1 Tax=Bremia lactucae TaxID=4779 RepID=A0A976IEM7_BRELC|nr:hypothetical protein CCR75_007479 [Bremia lactucae]
MLSCRFVTSCNGHSHWKGLIFNRLSKKYVAASTPDTNHDANVANFRIVITCFDRALTSDCKGGPYDVHGSRLKFYHDRDLDVTAERSVFMFCWRARA